MEPDNKEKLFCPEFALRLLGCNLEEAKTSGWQSQHGCIAGYVGIPKQHGQTMLNWSGQGGVFVQRFKKDVLKRLQDIGREQKVLWLFVMVVGLGSDLSNQRRIKSHILGPSLAFTGNCC